jgi:uncharacterized protein (TIGR03000 family)
MPARRLQTTLIALAALAGALTISRSGQAQDTQGTKWLGGAWFGKPFFRYGTRAYPKTDPFFDPYTGYPGGGLLGYYSQLANPQGARTEPSPEAANRALIHIKVPIADAQVWFGEHATQQQGMVREFFSPPLAAATNYVYEIRARWRQDNQDHDETRLLNVQAGQEITVDFGQPGVKGRGPAPRQP